MTKDDSKPSATARQSRSPCTPRLFRLAFVTPLLAGALYVAVAIIWLVPDRRIERHLSDNHP